VILWFRIRPASATVVIFSADLRCKYSMRSDRREMTKTRSCFLPCEVRRAFKRVTVRMLDLRSRGPGFDSRSGRCQVVITWMGD